MLVRACSHQRQPPQAGWCGSIGAFIWTSTPFDSNKSCARLYVNIERRHTTGYVHQLTTAMIWAGLNWFMTPSFFSILGAADGPSCSPNAM